MGKAFKIALASLAALLILPFFSGVATQTAHAVNAKQEICEGLGGRGGANCEVSGAPSLDTTIRNLVNIFSTIAGVAAVIMIIIGGFRYVTSQGDSGTISSAKNTILYAIIGLIVIAMAQLIVRFVLTKTTA